MQRNHTLPEKHLLGDLLAGVCLSDELTGGQKEKQITLVTADSRLAVQGTLFVAIAGTVANGHDFLDQVASQGCTSVLVEQTDGEALKKLSGAVDVFVVQDSRLALGRIAAAWNDHPSMSMILVGITGTNGKTTVSYLVADLLAKQGLQVGVLGTVNYRYLDANGNTVVEKAPYTTPEPLLLQRVLRQMADAGVSHVVMEVSSHALVQGRLGDILFDVAVFTNFSRDHLDYHGSLDQYFSAKALLFSRYLKKNAKAVICHQDPAEEDDNLQGKLVEICQDVPVEILRCGIGSTFDLNARLITTDATGSRINMDNGCQLIELQSHLVGLFNVENLVTAAGAGLALDVSLKNVVNGLTKSYGAPGRLQRVGIPKVQGLLERPAVFIDYAHTPDALKKVLVALNNLPHREIYCVVGCGGDRDTGKRAMMGGTAASLSDVVVITDDNPRSESPDAIRIQVAAGAVEAGFNQNDVQWLFSRSQGEAGFVSSGDRGKSIAAAIQAARKDDIVLIAGKGHENYQISGDASRFFDDYQEATHQLLQWDVGLLQAAVKGSLSGGVHSGYLGDVSTDSRSLKKGDIFLALTGDNFDGHAFLIQAAEKGAGCLIVSKAGELCSDQSLPRIVVQDTLFALGELAAYRRKIYKQMTAPVTVAVTGSCGKTTVKEMTAAIFTSHWPDLDGTSCPQVLKTKGNFNNLIGLPLSLLPMQVEHKVAVLEMGMNVPGEIGRLTEIADPDIACITNIYAAHLEGLQDINGVARAKEELFSGTGKDGILIVNGDDPHVLAFSHRYDQKKICFAWTEEGRALDPDVWADNIELTRQGEVRFVLHIAGSKERVCLQVAGIHNVSNGLAAAAIAHAAAVPIETIVAGLDAFVPVNNRMEIVKNKSGLSIINDSYNANPASMEAGLGALKQMAATTSMAVLGDMLELGETSEEAHFQLGRQAVEQGVDFLAIRGQFAEKTATGARENGMIDNNIRICSNSEDVVAWIWQLQTTGQLPSDSWILVKGSRAMQLEEIVGLLMGSK